ncbi:MAG TPA: glycosyltransferase family 9 protein [Bryobacteraceae bacterium]|nr:glycosyltransferase family 9 protein [Bryobacteraceae bacterium]
MTTVLDRLRHGARVSVIRLRSMGDCVLTTPALALLKAHRWDLHIHVIVEPQFREVFEGNRDVDEVCEKVPSSDLVLNFHGGTRSMLMTAASRAPVRVGFAHHRFGFIYTHRIPTAQEILGVDRKVHTAEHLASAMFWLGVPRTEIPDARVSSKSHPEKLPYAVIHPFAATPQKTWPAERFLAIARHLRASAGLESVFIAGPGDDPAPFSEFRVYVNESLDRVKALIYSADVFIGNDSGPAHIAAACGRPVVVLFGPSDPVVWAPWRTESRVLASPAGIERISVEQVIEAVVALKVHS